MIAPPEIVWAITSVDSSQDLQVLNRQVGLDIDGTMDQTKLVIDHLLEAAGKGEEHFPLTEEVLICRAMVLELKKHNFVVTIPYWRRIKWNDFSSRRNPSIFLDMIRSHAVWFFMQRKQEENIIEATEEDFTAARKIYVGRADTLVDKLSRPERILAGLIFTAPRKELYREDAASQMKISVNRVSQLVHGEKGKTGLIQKLPGFSAERASVEDGDRRVTRCLLKMGEYNPMNGFENIVSLITMEACKDGVNQKAYEKTDKQPHTVSSVSNIDNIYDSTTYNESNIDVNDSSRIVMNLNDSTKKDTNLHSISHMIPENGLLAYTAEAVLEYASLHPGEKGNLRAKKQPSSIELELMEQERLDQEREEHFKTCLLSTEERKALEEMYVRMQEGKMLINPMSLAMMLRNKGVDVMPKKCGSWLEQKQASK
jgi:hypothetical protein